MVLYECDACVENETQENLLCDVVGLASNECTCICKRHCVSGKKLNKVVVSDPNCKAHAKKT